MKVLDLQCRGRHGFEGWFGSEDEFRDQLQRGLVACPVCGDAAVTKLPSAPRLNLVGTRGQAPATAAVDAMPVAAKESAPSERQLAQMQAAWWRAAREAVQKAEDVGDRFADEARRIHHGEAEARGIRGRATGQQAQALIEEGIGIAALPDALKETLQ